MFGITQPSQLKSANPKLFFCKNPQKIIEDLYLFTNKSEIYILCAI